MKKFFYNTCIIILASTVLGMLSFLGYLLGVGLHSAQYKTQAINSRLEILESELCQTPVYIDLIDYANAIDSAIFSLNPKLDDQIRYDYACIIAFESLRTGIDPFLIISIIHTESRFVYDAQSPKNAIGLMQVHIPSWYKKFNMSKNDFGKALEIPRFNIYAGCEVLLIHINSCPRSLNDSLNCYNGRRINNSYGQTVLNLRDELFNAFGEDLP